MVHILLYATGLIRGSRQETSRADSFGVPEAVNHTTVLNYQQKRSVDTCGVPESVNRTTVLNYQPNRRVDTHGLAEVVDCNIVLYDYQLKRKDGADWYSPPFYTHLNAYKMCVNVDLSSWYTDLRVYSYLLPGDYDGGLTWPFRGTVVVRLLNQLSDDNHYEYVFDYSQANDSESQRVTQARRSKCRAPSTPFLPLAMLGYNPVHKCQYLKNNRLTFKVFVKTL